MGMDSLVGEAPEVSVFQSTLPLAEKLDRARMELLDLSARNRLLNMPRGSKGARTIEVIDEKSTETFRLLVREGKAFTFVAGRAAEGQANEQGAPDPDEITDLAQPEDESTDERGVFRRHSDTRLQTRLTGKGLQKRLLELYLDARTLEEEQGVNVLYLTLGSLRWVDPNNALNIRHAPLLLVPVALDRGTAGERFNLKARPEDFASNLSLEAYLDRVHTLSMPPFEASDTFDLAAYFDAVALAVKSKPDWAVVPDDISVGFFSFAKFLMYRDLDPANWPVQGRITDRPLIRGLLSDGFPGGEGMVDENAFIDPIIPPVDMLHILDCDSSQALAVYEVRNNRDMVIQGPPGTGKSQTIANIIASAIKDGKTVLFVAEKMAALEVVKQRLDEKGVGDACLELHSNKSNKRAVLEELRRTWELGAPRAPDPGSLIARLTETRDELNAHAARLHAKNSASGLTPYQVMGQLVRLRQSGEKPNDIELASTETWGADGFASRSALLADLSSRVTDIGKPADHPWVGVGIEAMTPTDLDRLLVKVQALSNHLDESVRQFEAAANLLEHEVPHRLSEVNALVELCRRIADAPHLSANAMGDDAWYTPLPIAELLREGEHFYALECTLKLQVASHAWEAALTETRQALTELPPTFVASQVARLSDAAGRLPRLLDEGANLAHILGRGIPSNFANLDHLAKVGERVASAPPASPETFASDLWNGGVERAGDLASAVAILESARNAAGNQVTDIAWDVDVAPSRAILAAKGTGFFRIFSGQWRRANALTRSLLKNPDQPLPVTLALLDTVERGQKARRQIEQDDAFGKSAFNEDWRGDKSRSAPLLALVEWMRSLKGLGAEPRLIASRSPEKTEVASRSKEVSLLCSDLSARLKAVWSDLAPVRSFAFGEAGSPEKVDLASLLQLAVRITTTFKAVQDLLLASPKDAQDALQVVDRLLEARRARDAIRDAGNLGRAAFDAAWRDDQSLWSQLKADAAWLEKNQDIRALAGRVGERESLRPRAHLLSASTAHALSSMRQISQDLHLDVEASLGESDVASALLDVFRWRLRRWLGESEQLFRWVGYRDRAARAAAQGCGELVARLGDGRLSADAVMPAFEMAYFEATYSEMVREDSALGRFDGVSHGRLVRDFVELDRERIAAASVEVVKTHHSAVPPRDSGSVGPLGVLRGEIQKKKAHMPIRKLIERAGPALRALKPVFMMSPLSVAQFLPPGSMEFDLLVMDEASQIQPVDALGAVARAKQVVVVGDPKQLPPTAFFAKLTNSDGDDEDDDTPVSDIESILGLFTARGLPTRMLRWHYRSRHQSLIAVSNKQFYENKLFVVPSPYTVEGGRGLRFHHVTDGLFDAGGKRVNMVEAKVVAEAIVAHARQTPKDSLGVAAFSAAQARAIYDHLEVLRRQLPPEVEQFFGQRHSGRFFIKNLENVQGDERDVMFISVGYGRSIPGGRVPMRFGPLGTAGGERRLNVLISRARKRCDVFASMTDEDIEPSFASTRKGVEAFRIFLQYARTGRLETAQVTGRDHDSMFELQVAGALRERGYQVQAQVGLAGFFIDLAILDDTRPGRYHLGVECDGAAYHSSKSSRDRDRLRQAVLEEHGWRIHRIWSTDWFQRPAEQLDLVIRRIEAAKADFDEQKEEALQAEKLAVESGFIEREDNPLEQGVEPFALYEEARLSRPAYRQDELHETPQGILTELIVQVVTIEGPVHIDEVTDRIRDAWGLKRTGSRITEVITSAATVAVRLSRIERNGSFLSLPGTVPIPRDRAGVVAQSLRKPEMLPTQELIEAAVRVVRRNFGATRDQVIQAVSRGLGIRLTSSQLRQVISEAIDVASHTGRLSENEGLITAVETAA